MYLGVTKGKSSGNSVIKLTDLGGLSIKMQSKGRGPVIKKCKTSKELKISKGDRMTLKNKLEKNPQLDCPFCQRAWGYVNVQS